MSNTLTTVGMLLFTVPAWLIGIILTGFIKILDSIAKILSHDQEGN